MTETTKPVYAVFDVESTGVDVFNDRIVQLVIATADANGNLLEKYEWLIDPGVEVPEEAAKVHGFTTEYLAEHGEGPHEALWEADLVFKAAVRDELTVVAFNLNFDLSILTAEMARHSLESRYGFWMADNTPLFDPLVVDRKKDRYRKGKRTLEAMAGHYGVPFDSEKAHEAGYDVEVTALVAAKIAGKYGVPSTTEQSEWYADWASNFQEYLRRNDPEATVNGDWPVRKEHNDVTD